VLGAMRTGVPEMELSPLLIASGVCVAGVDVGRADGVVVVVGLDWRRTSLRLGRGGGTERLTGPCATATEGCIGGGSRRFSSDARGSGGGGAGEDETDAGRVGASTGDVFFALSLSLSLSPQLAALSPSALAIFHRPLRLGGTEGFSPFVARAIMGGGRMLGISSSHTFSTIPVRKKAHSVHVVRRRARHHPFAHSG